MRKLPLLQLVIASGLSIAAALFTVRRDNEPGAFEVEMMSTASGYVQVYYDLGRGLSEAESVSVPVGPSSQLNLIRLPLPLGSYRALRFDPLNHEATVTFTRARLLGAGGTPIRGIAPGELVPNEQVAAFETKDGVATMQTKAGSEDPTLTVEFATPVVLTDNILHRLGAAWPRLLATTAGLWIALILLHTAWTHRVRARQSPQLSVLLLAFAAAAVSSYPVVFFGRSFVSPNNGTALLHHRVPTVPGLTDRTTADFRGSDLGAMMWAHLPYSVMQRRAVLDGEWPLWNRYNSAGVTLLGQGQSMFGDPIHLLVVAAGGASWAWDLKFLLAKALLAAGLGLCVWRITRDLGATALVTIAAPFIGFYSFRFNHPAFFSFSYSPWILYAWLWLTTAVTRRELAGGLVLFAVANLTVLGSGTAKEAYLSAAALNLLGALGWCFSPLPTGVTRLGRAALLIALGLCTALLTAPLWLTFFDALRTAHTAYEAPVAVKIDRRLLIGLFDDLFYNELTPQHYVYVPSGNAVLFLGVLAALTQLNALRRAPWALLCLLGAVASVLLAFEFTPARWVLAVPFLRNVHHVNNVFSGIALILLWVLAGWGFHAARTRLAAPVVWRPIVAAAGLFALALAAYFSDFATRWVTTPGWRGGWESLPAHAYFFTHLLLMLLAGAALVWLGVRAVRSPRMPGKATWVVGALALGVLLCRHSLHLKFSPGESLLTTPMARGDLAAASPSVQFVLADAHEPTRVLGMDNELFPGFASTYGFEGINGPDAIMNPFYRQLAEAAGLTAGADWRFLFEVESLSRHRRVLDLLGVGYVLGLHDALPPDSGCVKAADLDLHVYRRPGAWPRAFFTDRLATYDTPEAFVALLGGGDGRPFAAVQAGSADVPVLPSALSSRTVITAKNYRLTANTTRFTIDAPSAGVVVLSETYLTDDFRVTIDGRPAPYFRTNHAFKAVHLTSPGRHEISFTYRPKWFTFSLALAGCGVAGLAAQLLWLRRGARDAAARLQ